MIFNTNPYASPAEPGTAASSVDFRDIFVSWERLRILFNALLGLVSIAAGVRSVMSVSFWELAIEGAVLANVCFCLGHLLEAYLTLMLNRSVRAIRLPLFIVGTILAAGLALAAIHNVMVVSGQYFGF